MFKRFLAVFVARNYEFFRDRAALGWNLVFPVLLVVGFAFIFSPSKQTLYKVGVIENQIAHQFNDIQYIERVEYANQAEAMAKLRQHKVDFLIDFSSSTYWLNETSAKGYIVEKLWLSTESSYRRALVSGNEIRYLDWVVPGILAMNMMFSCLFGVGYVIVRYRKNSVLKRLSATPLTAFEFITAQITSRLCIVLALSSAIFIACNWVFDFYMIGRYFDLFVVTLLGTCSIIALALLIACRSESEEFIGGMLNLASWPMMMLSGVWFSLEGSPAFIQNLSQIFPLTHMLEGARKIMLDGATLADISYHILILVLQTGVFIFLGSHFFRWQGQAR